MCEPCDRDTARHSRLRPSDSCRHVSQVLDVKPVHKSQSIYSSLAPVRLQGGLPAAQVIIIVH